jgi:hypothetical protein
MMPGARTMTEMRDWLRDNKLEQIAELFEANDIDFNVLPELSEADLKKLGNFEFIVQFYVNVLLTPIKNSSIPWNPEYVPFVTIARLRIPRCDLSDPDVNALGEAVNRLSFSPWHTTEDQRPPGNVMRARVAYQVSSDFRHHGPEPTSLPL